MRFSDVIKSKILWFFTFSAIISIAAVSLNYFFKTKENDLEGIVRNLEKKIHEKESHLEKTLSYVAGQIQNGNADTLFKDNGLQDELGDGCAVFVYIRDTLKFWSENNTPVEDLYNYQVYDSAVAVIGNGYYRVISRPGKDFTLIGLLLIRHNYKYENDYLKNNFNPDLHLAPDIRMSDEKNQHEVHSRDGQYLFSLKFKKNAVLGGTEEIILFLVWLCALLFLVAGLFHVHRKLHEYYKSSIFFISGFIADVALLRVALFFFKIPGELYRTKLFSPLYFATSELIPSFGDLIVNTVLLIIIAFVIYRNLDLEQIGKKIRPYQQMIIGVAAMVFLAFLYKQLLILLQKIVIDSTIPYTLNNIFNLNFLSLAGFLIIALLILSYALVHEKIFLWIFRKEFAKRNHIIIASVSMFTLLLACFVFNRMNELSLVSFIVLSLGIWIFRESRGFKRTFFRIVFSLVFFSLISSWVIYSSNDYKEKEKRKSLAQKLATSQDPLAEYLYADVEKRIMADSYLQEMINNYPSSQYDIPLYLQRRYFIGYWSKYRVQVTVCSGSDSLAMKPYISNVHCNTYFNDLISRIGKPTNLGDLFVLNYETGGNSYLSVLEFPSETLKKISLYLELNSKFIQKGLGYPELLIDKKIFLNTDLSNYSYARYRNGELVDAYGKYYYSILRDMKSRPPIMPSFYDYDGYNHLSYGVDNNAELIVSRKNGTVLELIAPFSLLFMFYALLLLLIFIIINVPFRRHSIRLDFKNRLQVSMISIIFISFILIGVSMSYYIRNLNENKNLETLSEKALSILTEVKARLADRDRLTPAMSDYVSNYLARFSNVFFTDINLFDLDGTLIASSRPQVFDEGLISDKINPRAYYELSFNKKTIYTHKERIGSLDFYSAYLPLYNDNNKLIAYLNLPYFAKENELKQELSTFMMTFINIYVFLIAIAVVIALFIAMRMTRPLKEIREKIAHVQLGGKNEKIVWSRQNDEIGNLVNEYNRMIDELALSAELLSKSERESAWREMAKQVAHEIKNPLTPMKLSVQHLQRAWNEKAGDWDTRLKRFTGTMVEQIDSLAAIAKAFSDFAKMPRPEMKPISLVEAASTAIATFSGGKTHIQVDFNPTAELLVLADKKQIIRVFNNLITNAVQALGDQEDGQIIVNIIKESDKFIVSVSDNGPGIPEDMRSRIFTPNFSTKSEGMGLGLAMVKSIVEIHGGTIWFDSMVGYGTTFYFDVPVFAG